MDVGAQKLSVLMLSGSLAERLKAVSVSESCVHESTLSTVYLLFNVLPEAPTRRIVKTSAAIKGHRYDWRHGLPA